MTTTATKTKEIALPPPPTTRSQLGDPLQRAGIPLFDRNGTALSPKSRARRAKKRGLCGTCAIQTHEVRLIGQRRELTNDDVYKGICIRCNSKAVPVGKYEKWREKNPVLAGAAIKDSTHRSCNRSSAPPQPRDSIASRDSMSTHGFDSFSSFNVTVEPEEVNPKPLKMPTKTRSKDSFPPLAKASLKGEDVKPQPIKKSISEPISRGSSRPSRENVKSILKDWRKDTSSTVTWETESATPIAESTNTNSSILLKVFQASPLAYEDYTGKEIPIPFLDLETEETVLKEALEDSRIDVAFEPATANSLGTFLSEGNKFLHFSCHGHPRYLFIEDGYGGGQRLLVDHNLQGWIKAGGQKLSFVFVSACHSRSAGEAFVEAGVTHVVCCEQDGQALSNTAALVFSRDFYRAIANGKTIQQAYELAIYGVIHSSELARRSGVNPEKEAKKFALLPEEGVDHSIALFDPSTATRKGPPDQVIPPKKKQRTSMLPVPPQIFLGREVDLYRILKALFVKKARLVRITGGPGLGKVSLAKALAQYIEKRSMWGSTVWLPSPLLGMNDDDDEIASWSELFSLVEDSGVCAHGFKFNSAYHSARKKILNLFYEKKTVLIINAKELSHDSIFKVSICLDDLFEHTKNTKVIVVQDDANTIIQSQRSSGFPSCEVQYTHQLTPLGFAATAAVFSRVCPLSANPLLTEEALHQRRSDKTLFKVLGKGIPALTVQIARQMPQEEFDQLVEQERSLHSRDFDIAMGIVQPPPPLSHNSSRGGLALDSSDDESGPRDLEVTLMPNYPQLFPYHADANKSQGRPSTRQISGERRSFLYVRGAEQQLQQPRYDGQDDQEDDDDDESEDSDRPPLRSQDEVFTRFAPILRKEGKIHRKGVTSFIRKAVKGERVVTTIDGKQETKYEVKDNSSWLVCGKAAGEYYVLTDQQFQTNYETESPKEISPDNLFPTSKRLRQAGFMEYRSRRKVWARRVNEFDMHFFRHGIEDETNSGAYFVAPWGESMLVEQGDYLVMQYPERNDEIYRIEYHVFHDSYVDDDEPKKPKDEPSFSIGTAAIAVAIGAGVAVAALALHRLFFSKRRA